jgi:uncharacterized membrane protein YeaQ/YmgE (transglycosylase-associated protein family)
MGELIGLLIFGAIIGALARLVMPGRQSIGILWTIVLGVLGALAGYFLAGLLGVAQTGGIDWIRWVISVIVAVILISIYIGAASRRKV